MHTGEAMSDFKVIVQDAPPTSKRSTSASDLCHHSNVSRRVGEHIDIYCDSPVKGKYVVIQSMKANVQLSLCEVAVFGMPTEGMLMSLQYIDKLDCEYQLQMRKS